MRFTKYNNPSKKRRKKVLSYDEKIARAASDMIFLQNQGVNSTDAYNYTTNKYNLPK